MKKEINTTKHKDIVMGDKEFLNQSGTEDVLINKDDSYLKAFSTGRNGKKRGAFKTLFVLYKGNYLKILTSLIFYCLKTAPILYLSIATAEIIDAITLYISGAATLEAAINTAVIQLGIVLVGCVVINIPLDVLYARFTSSAIRSVEANLRSSIIRKLHMLSISYYKHIQSGRLQSKIMRDVEAVSELSNQIMKNLICIAFAFAFTIVSTSLRNPLMLLFFGIVAPISALITNMFRNKLRESNRVFRNEMENTSASVMEAMELIPVTKAHGVEGTQIKKIDRQFEKVAEDGYVLDKTNAFFGRMMWLSGVLMHLVAIAITVWLAIIGEISVGDIVLYSGYFSSLTSNINSILGLIPLITKGMESVNSVGDVLTAVDIEDNYHKLKPPRLKGAVKFDDVCYKYEDGDGLVLKHFNLDVKAGETIAFVGASGCGKSTAINLIIGFGKVNEGRVLIDGMNINNFNLHSYRSQLAVVPQQPILFSGTIRDNITYGADGISEEELNTAVEQANLKEFIDSLSEGLNTVIGEHGGTLSGGQRQRIAIARALVRNPSIVILDEATSALDTVSERKIQVAIDNVAHGRTTFIVAHRLSTIRHADRIVVIDDGHPVESGTFEELMELKGEFYKLQTMQNE